MTQVAAPRHPVRAALVSALGVAIAVATWSSDAAATLDQFGWSVAIDGNNVLIGARLDDTNGQDVGQAHLFDATTGALLQTFDDPTVTSSDAPRQGHINALAAVEVVLDALAKELQGRG